MTFIDIKHIVFNFCIFSLLISCTQREASSQSEVVTDDGWRLMLNDELNGWHEKGPVDATMSNGELSLTTTEDHNNAMLITESTYDNFQFSFEFKSADSLTGIIFRFDDRLKTTSENAGYMVSTDYNPNQQNPVGTIVGIARSTVLDNNDHKAWNTLNVEAAGTHLKVYLNEKLVAEANDKQFSTGKICLLAPSLVGSRVTFRNLKIQPLVMAAVVTELVEDRYRSDDTRSWESLFDGSTLAGWNPVGDGSWKVEDGVIHGYSGVKGGFLVSKNAYKNFYLTTQFKIIKEDNSGIFIRKTPDSAAVTITDALECNIYDHNGPAHAYSTGSVATHARAWYGMIDYENWNSMEIFTEEEHIVMYVNGRKSSETYVPSKFNKTGNLCLQGGIKVFAEDKGPSDIYFKDIKIKSMD